jgi:hypothetical protein
MKNASKMMNSKANRRNLSSLKMKKKEEEEKPKMRSEREM